MITILKKIQTKKYLILGVLSLLTIGYLLGIKVHEIQAGYNKAREITLLKQQEIIDELHIELGTRSTQIQTMDATISDLQQTIHTLEEKNQNLSRNLSFYRKIMQPNASKTGINLDSISIEPLLTEKRYRYQIVLTQTNKKRRQNTGYLNFEIEGSEEGHTKTLNAQDIGLSPDEKKFSFRYYQVLEGDIKLPDNFTPDIMKVKIISHQSENHEHTLSWPEIVSKNANS